MPITLPGVISGPDTIRAVRKITDTILISFSCGKDSIAAWLACKEYGNFRRIIPFYLYGIPGLRIVEDSLAYYEDFFKTKIHRMPQPAHYSRLANFAFQPPERVRIIRKLDLPTFSREELEEDFREVHKAERAYTAIGVRAVDTLNRRTALMRYGPITQKSRKFYPIWDLRKAEMIALLESSGCKLPPDYALFGRSLDGITYDYIMPLKEHYPDDYERIKFWYPMVEVEIKRREFFA
jgi:hypothetical protein